MRNKNLNLKMSRQKPFKLSNSGNGKKLKWWHILLIVLGVIIIAAGIAAAIILGRIDNIMQNPENYDEVPPVIIGSAETLGTYYVNGTTEYVLCEYTELISGKKQVVLQKEKDVRYEAHYVFVAPDGTLNYQFGGKYTGEKTPEQIKTELLTQIGSLAGYTPEIIAKCDVLVFDPVSFTKVKLSSVEVLDNGDAAIKFSAGAIDGELSEECTLNGSYTKAENEFSFTFNELPEDEVLKGVAEKLLTKATYKSYIMYGEWQNTLTFGDSYTLYLEAEQK